MKNESFPLKFYFLSLGIHILFIVLLVLSALVIEKTKRPKSKMIEISIEIFPSTPGLSAPPKSRFDIPDFNSPNWFEKTDRLLKEHINSSNYQQLLFEIYQKYQALPKTQRKKVFSEIRKKQTDQSDLLKREGGISIWKLEAYREWKKQRLHTLFRRIPDPDTNIPLLRYRLNPQTGELEDIEAKLKEYNQRMLNFERSIHHSDSTIFRFYRIHDLYKVLSNKKPPKAESFHLGED